jgi:hypothetical protein
MLARFNFLYEYLYYWAFNFSCHAGKGGKQVQ